METAPLWFVALLVATAVGVTGAIASIPHPGWRQFAYVVSNAGLFAFCLACTYLRLSTYRGPTILALALTAGTTALMAFGLGVAVADAAREQEEGKS